MLKQVLPQTRSSSSSSSSSSSEPHRVLVLVSLRLLAASPTLLC
jgi:hypothetical protein